MFEFFVDGISIQGPSLVSTLSHVFSTTSTATLIASVGGCSRSFELPIQLIDLTSGTITGGGEVCFADVPTTITSLVAGTKDGVELSTSTVTTFYQWQSSLDGVVWNNILGAQSIDYTPPSLNQTTHFRRKLVATAGGKTCEAFSNQITNTSTNQGFELLPQYANQAVLSGLDAGVYKIEVRSLNNNCSGAESIYTFVSEIIEVLPNPDLFIVSGPFVDADLCGGNPGRLSIEVFDNNQGELFFYYEGEQIQEEDNPQVNEQTHTLLIHTPVENGTLRIVNEQGCFITKELNLQLGEPNFSFTSASFETTNVILAREEIQFENTSTDPYIRSEWLFGDFDSPLVVPNVASSTFVRHSYPVSGAYNVTLRIFNSTGCFKEITQTVSVGRGYSILLPNVFSPNNDSINDVFRPITTGLSKVTFSVYDNLGNLIYTESVAELDLDNIQGVEIGGWDGQNAPSVPFFIYTIEALLLDGVTKVEDTGTFILLR
ncbi:gliding motility-associated C-terminal domain-containing protein [Flavobacteriaceae bacterium]|nr:gliding motility-associated C-terminal domain-containing protein [Flavobacteriaceae bacterium]